MSEDNTGTWGSRDPHPVSSKRDLYIGTSPCEAHCKDTRQWKLCEGTGQECEAFRHYVERRKYDTAYITVDMH
jgi:hypothetical protein